MSRRVRHNSVRSAARVLLAVVFALGVVVGPTGAMAVTPTTMDSPFTPERVNVSSTGRQSNDWSDHGAISDDGRYVAYQSDATNLAGEDVNGTTSDVFYRDRLTGKTTMVSDITTEAAVWDRGARSASISDDGRYVAFITGKSLVATDTNGDTDLRSGTGIDVYVRDMETGEFLFCDIAGDGSDIGDRQMEVMMSGNGEYVVVGTMADIAEEDANNHRDVYRYDLSSGETTLVSPTSEEILDWERGAKPIGISDDGRYVAFITGRSIDEADTNGGDQDYYRKDLQTGVIDFVAFNGGVDYPDRLSPEDGEVQLSGDGQYLVFETRVSLVPEDIDVGDGNLDVYLYEFDGEVTTLISPDIEGMMSPGRGSRTTSIDDDGSRVVFFTGGDFVAEDTNDGQDLYWYDVAAGTYHLMSLPRYGVGSVSPKSIAPAAIPSPGTDIYNVFLSGDGSTVVFESGVRFTADDTNAEDDIFVRELVIDLLGGGDVRLAGDDRYDTSVQISQEAFPKGADTVVIATGSDWPDALCGSALSGAVDGPILLAAPGGLTDSVKAEIARLGATDAYILGSSRVVSLDIERELDDMLSGYVTRLAGSDRYWTAKAITNEVIELRPDAYDGTALVTTGGNYADAMAAAPLSAALAWPILLTNPLDDSLYAPADLSTAVVLGGTTAVPQVVEDDLVGLIGAPNVVRLAGDTRYDTAALIAQYGVDNGMHWDGVGIATGQNFPDALAGGASLGRLGAVMLLTPSTSLAPAAATKLTDNAAGIGTVYVLGGSAAVSTSVMDEILTILGL
jgi:putative cell wall-binding protein